MVTVLVPFRGGLGHVPNLNMALDSLAAQTRPAARVLVIDDHSDPTAIADVVAREGPLEFEMLKSPGEWPAAALNVGLRAADTEWIGLQDADDLSAPDRFARLLEFAESNPTVGAIGSNCEFIGPDSSSQDTGWTRDYRAACDAATTDAEIRALLPQRVCVIPPSMILRRSALVEIGGWNESLRFSAYDLLLRLLPVVAFAKLPDRLYSYRLHAGSSTQLHAEEFAAALADARTRFRPGA